MPKVALGFRWIDLLGLLAAYFVILAANGYVFGADDQVEVLPYALFLDDSSLYASDFYVQYISRAIPNERYFFSYLLSITGSALPFFCGLFHLISTLFLLAGWHRIAALFLRTEALRWALVLIICLPPFYGINLGGNELYYNTFIPSLLAKSVGVWALYFFLRHRWNQAFLLMALSTFIHPVAGAQLFLIGSGVLVLEKFTGRPELSWKKILGLIVAFLFSAGAWVLFLKFNFDQGSIDRDLLFEIMEFRVSHHYFPSYFPLKYYLVLLPLFGFGWVYYFKKSKTLFWFFTLTLLGCLIYTLAVELLQHSSVLTSQWFKSTIWLKAFSMIAVLAWLESRLPFLQQEFFQKITKTGLWLLGLFSLFAMAFPFSVFQNRSYNFFFSSKQNPSVNIAQQVQKLSPKDAVFIIPINETAFKYYSQRSCYIDYKTVVHRKDAFPVWYERVQEVYGINLQNRRAGNALQEARKNYLERSEEEWLRLKAKGPHFLLMPKEKKLTFPVLVENTAFRVYRMEE